MVNRSIIQGNVVKDPILSRTKKKPISVTSIFLASKSEGRNKRTDYIRVTFWGKLAERVVDTIKKGDTITVEGRLESERYTDKNNNTHLITSVRASDIPTKLSAKTKNIIKLHHADVRSEKNE